MRKKGAFFLNIIMINCIIMGVAWAIPKNRYINVNIEKGLGCVVVEAAEAVKDEKATNITGDAELISKESEEEEKEASGDIISNELEEKELREISGDAEEEEDVSEEDLKTEEEAHELSCIYNVSFPTDSRVYLDPDNLSGRGQIFSDEFKVENYGNTDVTIKIKNIEVYYRSTEKVYELSGEEVTDGHPYVKKLNVDIVWKNEEENTEKVLNVIEGISDENVLDLKASKYDEDGNFIELNKGSTGLFYFTGSMNANSALEWNNGDMIVSFDYEIVEAEEEQETQIYINDDEEDITIDVLGNSDELEIKNGL